MQKKKAFKIPEYLKNYKIDWTKKDYRQFKEDFESSISQERQLYRNLEFHHSEKSGKLLKHIRDKAEKEKNTLDKSTFYYYKKILSNFSSIDIEYINDREQFRKSEDIKKIIFNYNKTSGFDFTNPYFQVDQEYILSEYYLNGSNTKIDTKKLIAVNNCSILKDEYNRPMINGIMSSHARYTKLSNNSILEHFFGAKTIYKPLFKSSKLQIINLEIYKINGKRDLSIIDDIVKEFGEPLCLERKKTSKGENLEYTLYYRFEEILAPSVFNLIIKEKFKRKGIKIDTVKFNECARLPFSFKYRQNVATYTKNKKYKINKLLKTRYEGGGLKFFKFWKDSLNISIKKPKNYNYYHARLQLNEEETIIGSDLEEVYLKYNRKQPEKDKNTISNEQMDKGFEKLKELAKSNPKPDIKTFYKIFSKTLMKEYKKLYYKVSIKKIEEKNIDDQELEYINNPYIFESIQYGLKKYDNIDISYIKNLNELHQIKKEKAFTDKTGKKLKTEDKYIRCHLAKIFEFIYENFDKSKVIEFKDQRPKKNTSPIISDEDIKNPDEFNYMEYKKDKTFTYGEKKFLEECVETYIRSIKMYKQEKRIKKAIKDTIKLYELFRNKREYNKITLKNIVIDQRIANVNVIQQMFAKSCTKIPSGIIMYKQFNPIDDRKSINSLVPVQISKNLKRLIGNKFELNNIFGLFKILTDLKLVELLKTEEGFSYSYKGIKFAQNYYIHDCFHILYSNIYRKTNIFTNIQEKLFKNVKSEYLKRKVVLPSLREDKQSSLYRDRNLYLSFKENLKEFISIKFKENLNSLIGIIPNLPIYYYFNYSFIKYVEEFDNVMYNIYLVYDDRENGIRDIAYEKWKKDKIRELLQVQDYAKRERISFARTFSEAMKEKEEKRKAMEGKNRFTNRKELVKV